MQLDFNLILASFILFSKGSNALFSVYDDYYSSPKYAIKYNDRDVYYRHETAALLDASFEANGSYHIMKSPETDYICHVPQVPHDDNNSTSIKEETRDQIIQRAVKKIEASLENITAFYPEGYWIYAFSAYRELSQFNGSPQMFLENKLAKFVLGRINKDEARENYFLNKEGDIWYLRLKLEGGTVCDLTGKPRAAEVQFVCDPSQELPTLKWAKEYKSCHYHAQIGVPDLCSDDLLGLNKEEKVYEVMCTRVVDEDTDFIEKEELIKSTFQDHSKKISVSDYKLESLGHGIFLGMPSAKGKINIFIHGSDAIEDGFLQSMANAFSRILKTGKLGLLDPALAKPDLKDIKTIKYYSYIYGIRGSYLTTILIEWKENGEVVLSLKNGLSNLERNLMELKMRDKGMEVEDGLNMGEVDLELDSAADLGIPEQQQQQGQTVMEKKTDNDENYEGKQAVKNENGDQEEKRVQDKEQEIIEHDEL